MSMKSQELNIRYQRKVDEYDNKLDRIEHKLDIILEQLTKTNISNIPYTEVHEKENKIKTVDKLKIEEDLMFIPDIDTSNFKTNEKHYNMSEIKDIDMESGLDVFRKLKEEKK